MAKISYETFQQVASEQENTNNGVGFFSLKNDGDEAIVRIMHDSQTDYDILSVHPIKVGDKYTKVECLNDSTHHDACPLCKADTKLQYRFFVHMIQYVKDENGGIVSKPVVWDRSAKEMSSKLNAMLQEYGPLSDCIFKIRRNGKAGDMKTTYEIMFANPNVYRPDLYPKDAEVFNGYSVSGKQVMVKTADEMVTFLSSGSFPERQSNTATESNQNGGYAGDATPRNNPVAPNYATTPPATAAGARPNRYY